MVGGNNWTIGSTDPTSGNVIAHNGAPYGGIVNGGPTGANIRKNRIFDNQPLGIDLYVGGSGGVTPNDPGDADAGPNNGQNYPIVTSVTPGASTTNVTGRSEQRARRPSSTSTSTRPPRASHSLRATCRASSTWAPSR